MADLACSDGGLRELALFAGAGGGILGGQLLGWNTICAVECDPYAANVLCARQNDGLLQPFPVWDDVCTFDGRPWRGVVDVVSGGFPCQDISAAGKGAGIEGERSGLWSEFARIIGEVRPRYAFVENSPVLTARGLGVVLGDLASLGYDARWGVLGAADVGAPHKRQRIWIVANSNSESLRELPGRECGPERTTQPAEPEHDGGQGAMANVEGERRGEAGELRRDEPPQRASCSSEAVGNTASIGRNEKQTQIGLRGSQLPIQARGPGSTEGRAGWPTEPDVGRKDDGLA